MMAAVGVLTDVASLEFVVVDSAGLQVYPPAGRHTVDLTADKLATGIYVADYTVDASEAFGLHQIRWYYKVALTDAETRVDENFDVVDALTGGSGYVLPSTMRDEGVTATDANDARLVKLITRESNRVDRVCGQWFSPRRQTVVLDGRDSPTIELKVPVIAISAARVNALDLDLAAVEIYNRHLNYGVDDRENPRIEFIESWPGSIIGGVVYFGQAWWPRGTQNVEFDGVFGYTDPPGPIGKTPELIEHATSLLVVKQLAVLTDVEQRHGDRVRNKLSSETTRDQSYTLDGSLNVGRGISMTGDPEVDEILVEFATSIGITSVPNG